MGAVQIIRPLHGLRGIAALTVVLGHLTPSGAPALGVVLFFVLSGFLIGKLYLEQPATKDAMWRYSVARFARVYPLFAFVILLTGLLNALTPAGIFDLSADELLAHLLLVGSARTVWTISTEFQFYAAFLLIWLLRARVVSAPRLLVPVFLVSALVAIWAGPATTRIGLWSYLHVFVLGLLVAAFASSVVGDARRSLAAALLPVLIGAYAAAYALIPWVYPSQWVYLDFVSVAICGGLIWAVVVARDCWATRLLGARGLFWLGDISFGIYLFHRHAQWLVDTWIGDVSPWLTLAPKVALTLVLAQLANCLIERPARQLLRRLGRVREA